MSDATEIMRQQLSAIIHRGGAKHPDLTRWDILLDAVEEMRDRPEQLEAHHCEARRSRRIDELERICAESYQVLGQFMDKLPDSKALDNLAEARLVHDDVLPCKVES